MRQGAAPRVEEGAMRESPDAGRLWQALARAALAVGAVAALVSVVVPAAWPAQASPARHARRIKEFPVPTPNSSPEGITTGPDGNLWFTENYYIGRITPGGVFTEFPLPNDPLGISAGPDGNLWFTEYSDDKIGRITPSGVFTEFPIPTPDSGPVDIAAGS